jgi:DNA-binding transcriptional ArsR family regulator
MRWKMDAIFRALADPSRRRLLDRLNERNGQTLRELGSGLDMARQSVTKHLAILEAAELITTVRRGREKLHYLNPAPINDIAERWIHRYDRERVHALADLKRALEDQHMGQTLLETSETLPLPSEMNVDHEALTALRDS